jgi:hypothetical protein
MEGVTDLRVGLAARRVSIAGVCVVCAVLAGCGKSEEVKHLEKQNAELQAELAQRKTTDEFSLERKCASDAKVWFRENMGSRSALPPTLSSAVKLLDFTNHYSKSLNKCFILVQLNLGAAGAMKGQFSESHTLYDVYDNNELGGVSVMHFGEIGSEKPPDDVSECSVAGKKCKSFEEFMALAGPYVKN